jgi:hypothetical protein
VLTLQDAARCRSTALRHVPTTCAHDLAEAAGLPEVQEGEKRPAATLLRLAPCQRQKWALED